MMAQPTPMKIGHGRSFFSIPKEDVVSVKDSVTFGLPTQGLIEGMEAGGSGGQPAMPRFKFIEGYAAEGVGPQEVGKWHSCHSIQKKGSC